MKRPDYQPGQRVITFFTYNFDKPTPRLAWCITGGKCVHWSETHWSVSVTHQEDEKVLSFGECINASKVKPYTPELWAACQDWIQRRAQLAADLESLTRQRIPQAPDRPMMAPWQDLLFAQEIHA